MSAPSPVNSLVAEILNSYACGPVPLPSDPDAAFRRHLVFDHMIEPAKGSMRQRFQGLARAIRDVLAQRWLQTKHAYHQANPKRVYYLSMEFLIGRMMANNILNLMLEPVIQQIVDRERLDLEEVAETEPDAGLGNGGLGRLAACFIDSLATLGIPAHGYGLRYEYGMFRQEIQDGYQVEAPDNWLRRPDPWETVRYADTVEVKINASIKVHNDVPHLIRDHPTTLRGIPYDRPVIGYGGKTINSLRLWDAFSPEFFDLGEFNHGDFFGAVHAKVAAENLTRVLYPDDSTSAGRHLRFVQEYFLVACSLADIINRFKRTNDDWRTLPDKVAIQLNDTHPALAVAELMRILLDVVHLGWEQAWDLTVRTLAYTNHTLLPEALEKWSVEIFEIVLPRHLEIIYEINRRFLDSVRARFPGDEGRLARVSLIEDGPVRHVRMANLAIVGTHSTNGVAAIHSELLRSRTVKDLAEMFPDRFSNKTNGVTPRRWLLLANPELSGLIRDAIGTDWITDLSQLRRLVPLAEDPGFRSRFRQAKRDAKVRFAAWVKSATGQVVDPDSIFDAQVKRIHEYKRQLLNVLHIIVLYNRLKAKPNLEVPPRTFFFAGKAAPAYQIAKLIIKLINNVAAVIDGDRAVRGKLKVLFLPDYNVTLAQRLIPASDVSEQISTAGYEASGTSNMKFMMNGALTVGTRDGATIEMAEEAGEDNFFLFGLTAEEVAESRGWYQPRWHYEHEPETRQSLDLIAADYFSRTERGIFQPIWDTLLTWGDHYMHLADLTAYIETHRKVGALYAEPDGWARKAILNLAHSGKFSSDRTIMQYAADIWKVQPCPVSETGFRTPSDGRAAAQGIAGQDRLSPG
ncbi:MAG: glycogen/starch/alpha-glucan phosphorylase [Planctomycetaceae bacterium]|nr:glycogen/starch/alpha-glucan phosphorylase [Planctomycetaceae bacterium]